MGIVFLMVNLRFCFGVFDVGPRVLKSLLGACRFRLLPCKMRNIRRVEYTDSDTVWPHRNGVQLGVSLRLWLAFLKSVSGCIGPAPCCILIPMA